MIAPRGIAASVLDIIVAVPVEEPLGRYGFLSSHQEEQVIVLAESLETLAHCGYKSESPGRCTDFSRLKRSIESCRLSSVVQAVMICKLDSAKDA